MEEENKNSIHKTLKDLSVEIDQLQIKTDIIANQQGSLHILINDSIHYHRIHCNCQSNDLSTLEKISLLGLFFSGVISFFYIIGKAYLLYKS